MGDTKKIVISFPILMLALSVYSCGIRPVEGRSPRILTGSVPEVESSEMRTTVTDTPTLATETNLPGLSDNTTSMAVVASVQPAESNQPPSYLVPPPISSVVNKRFTNTELPKLFTPLNVPSIQNHRLSGNWSSEISKLNEVKITSVNKHTLPPTTAPGKNKIRHKVDVEKFRECIFFRVCKKSECFHYGRFGMCKTNPTN